MIRCPKCGYDGIRIWTRYDANGVERGCSRCGHKWDGLVVQNTEDAR